MSDMIIKCDVKECIKMLEFKVHDNWISNFDTKLFDLMKNFLQHHHLSVFVVQQGQFGTYFNKNKKEFLFCFCFCCL